MNEESDRNSVIALLDKLGAQDDSEVLAAGRALHAKIDEMGVGWEQLLVPDQEDAQDTAEAFDDEDAEAFDDEVADDGDGDEDAEDAPADDDFEPVGDAVEDIKSIDRLLAANGISAEFRDELQGYKKDIKENEFSAADCRYIQALQKRLAGGKKSKPRRKKTE